MKVKIVTLFCLIIIFSSPSYSQPGGNTPYQFLNLPISARVTALGGNLISVRDNDLNVALRNPSLLTDSMNNNVALSFINYFAGVKYGYAALGKHLKKGGNCSAGLYYLDYGKMKQTDATGDVLGVFGAIELSFNLSYAHSVIDSNFSIGVDLKTIYSAMDSYTSLATALDFGATYYNPKTNFGLAAVVKNVGRQWISYRDGNRESLPFEIQLATSYKLKKFPLRLSIVYQNIEKWDLTYNDPATPYVRDPATGEIIEENKYKAFGHKLMRHLVIGGEFAITKNLFARVGFNYKRREEFKSGASIGFAGITYGLGLKLYKFHLSYGRANYLLAGATNTVSFSFDINSFYSR